MPVEITEAEKQQLRDLIPKEYRTSEGVYWQPPYKSTGDIYHIAMMLFIFQAINEEGQQLPTVYMGGVETQAAEDALASNLAFASQCFGEGQLQRLNIVAGEGDRLPQLGSSQMESLTRQILQDQQPEKQLLDQKLSSLFISTVMRVLGQERTASLLIDGVTRAITPEQSSSIKKMLVEGINPLLQHATSESTLILVNTRAGINNVKNNTNTIAFAELESTLREGDNTLTIRTGNERSMASAFDGIIAELTRQCNGQVFLERF